ncbi:MAG: hypothetical protein CVV64_09675 [Candidatus Wallbacteria bacterium HGW-Wallbacteria-1]|jgi:capsular exopolysaccharide synthesis family protein|uniref:AAA domain-containing protein n=1 Tax=Candidatus Wallbacteria bacterium HGW-Wallbacteria-1 TaxID=2013854 RepID=A0A2N1PQJ7_9BACT|nr:MAG: hypothetical protein CVV64_09675 [Candidatus Wallbacteria bacterium HGW-Wallbacteria-1]
MDPFSQRDNQQFKEFTLHDYFHVIRKRYLVVLAVMVLGFSFTLVFTLRQKPVYRASGSLEVRASQSYYQTDSIRLLAFSLNTYAKVITSDELIREALENTTSKMTVAEVISGLRVNQEPGTFIINLTLQGHDQSSLATVLNSLMDALVRRTKTEHRRKITDAIANLRDQMGDIEANLRTSEKELKEFEALRGIAGEKRRYEEIQNKILELSKQLYQTTLDREQTALTIQSMKNRLRSVIGTSGEINTQSGGGPGIAESVVRLIEGLARERGSLLRIYKPNHPKVLELDRRIDKLRRGEGEEAQGPTADYRQKMDELSFALAGLEIREKTLKSLIESERGKLSEAPDEDLVYIQLKRKLETAQKVYDSLVGRYSEINVVQSTLKAMAVIVERAVDPRRPEYSRMSVSLFLALISSFIMGIALTFLIEHLDNTIKNHEEAESILGYQVMGLVPEIAPASARNLSTSDSPASFMDLKLVTMHDPMHIAAEAFNSLRINMKFALTDRPQKTIIITSPIREAGKTLVASNLAISYARSGLKTLLVDVDLRKPMIHYVFNTDNIRGLTNFFMDELTVDEVVVNSGIRNLDLITSGLLPDNPVELLDSRIFDQIIHALSTKYDHVIFDCPPLLGFPDSLLIASKMDVVLYLVSLRNTKVQQARAGLKLLHNAEAAVVGLLCNRVKEDELGGYYYRYS